jgi:myo-inositol-1(or 4)-monophosphatase
MELQQLEPLLAEVAEQEILARFRRVASSRKADGSLITEADTAAQSRLAAELAARWPDIPLLGEEMTAPEQQSVLAGGGPFWCLDPLDGTTNFASGLPYFAISLALIADGEVQAGLVYDPNRRECFRARRGAGAWLNGEPLRIGAAPDTLAESVALVDMKRLPVELATRLAAAAPYRSQRSFGAVALDWCWLAAGRCHLYLHVRQNLWDYAAGHLVFTEAGGVGCLTDRPEGLCNPALYLGRRVGVGAANQALFDAWRDWIDGDPRAEC